MRGCKNGLYKSIYCRRNYLCAGTDFDGKDEAAPWTYYGIIGLFRAVLGAVGVYEPFSEWAGAGANVPLLGFGNVLWTGVKEAIDKEGILGVFKGGFTSSAVGISAALVFSYLASLIFDSKMKK